MHLYVHVLKEQKEPRKSQGSLRETQRQQGTSALPSKHSGCEQCSTQNYNFQDITA